MPSGDKRSWWQEKPDPPRDRRPLSVRWEHADWWDRSWMVIGWVVVWGFFLAVAIGVLLNMFE